MRKLTLFICSLCMLIFIAAPVVNAQQCKANGCGPSGFLGKLILDKFDIPYFTECKFKQACNKHDLCYSTCMECSPQHGSAQCDKKKLCVFSKTKKACDQSLYDGIAAANAGNKICGGFGFAYKWAVKTLGCFYYYGYPKFAPEQAEKFQRDFKAFYDYYMYNMDNKRPLNEKEIESLLELLSRTDSLKDNAFAFDADNQQAYLAITALKPLPAFIISDEKTFRKRRLLNGIDVTRMRLGDGVLNLKDASRKFEGIDLQHYRETEISPLPKQ